jgi:hypothetical protein
MQVATQERSLGLASGEGEALWWFEGLAMLIYRGTKWRAVLPD